MAIAFTDDHRQVLPAALVDLETAGQTAFKHLELTCQPGLVPQRQSPGRPEPDLTEIRRIGADIALVQRDHDGSGTIRLTGLAPSRPPHHCSPAPSHSSNTLTRSFSIFATMLAATEPPLHSLSTGWPLMALGTPSPPPTATVFGSGGPPTAPAFRRQRVLSVLSPDPAPTAQAKRSPGYSRTRGLATLTGEPTRAVSGEPALQIEFADQLASLVLQSTVPTKK